MGLPLLMEFRCWQDDGANGINRFDTSTAPVGAGGWAFRAHSTGGIDQALATIFIDPDLEERANGGFDPTSVPPGEKTPGNDPEVYMGAADFVVRVSRSHSIWFPATDPNDPGGAPFPTPSYNPPVFLPGPLDQPLGTSVEFSFRGAQIVTGDPIEDASLLDLYGDHYIEEPSPCDGSYNHNSGNDNTTVSFDPNTDVWFDDINAIEGAQFYQVRITWTSNPLTGLAPELTAFGLTWEN